MENQIGIDENFELIDEIVLVQGDFKKRLSQTDNSDRTALSINLLY
ncbi:hypothetical protein [Lederbergia panacisoli]|nr:hypothetical protein [Lederbergia panacisoli]MCR2823783.1 hypothetical protein [Lederbergia panacisoli]